MPQIVKFIVDITDQFTEHFPNLWKLGQAYLGGQLHIREVLKIHFVLIFLHMVLLIFLTVNVNFTLVENVF